MGQHPGQARQQANRSWDFSLVGDVDGRQAIREARLQGMREGFTGGYQAARERALHPAQVQLKQEQTVLEAEQTSLLEQTRQELADKQDALPALAMQETRRILQQVLHHTDEAFLHLFAQAAAHVSSAESAVLRANPYGCAVASRHLDWMRKQIDGLQELEIRLTEGDDGLCILETAAGSVDASMETQFQKAMQLAGFLDEKRKGDCHAA